jgi:hypothetical protein
MIEPELVTKSCRCRVRAQGSVMVRPVNVSHLRGVFERGRELSGITAKAGEQASRFNHDAKN